MIGIFRRPFRYSLKKSNISLQIIILSQIIPLISLQANNSKIEISFSKTAHIMLTPEEAAEYNIENLEDELSEKEKAENLSKNEKHIWKFGMIIGVSALTGAFVYYGLPSLANILYPEGVRNNVLKGNYQAPTHQDNILENFNKPIIFAQNGANAGLGAAKFWAGYWNDLIHGRFDRATLRLGKAFGKVIYISIKFVGRYTVRQITPQFILDRHDFERVRDFDELIDELNIGDYSKTTKKLGVFLSAVITGNILFLPIYFKKLNKVSKRYYDFQLVDVENIKLALEKIYLNGNLACKRWNAGPMVSISILDIKGTRFKLGPGRQLERSIYYRGKEQSVAALVDLDLIEDGLFYYLDDFLCETASSLSPFSKPVSINQLIRDGGL